MSYYPELYAYVVTFKRMVHGVETENKCHHVDLAHAKQYANDLMKKVPDVYDVKIEKV